MNDIARYSKYSKYSMDKTIEENISECWWLLMVTHSHSIDTNQNPSKISKRKWGSSLDI